MSVKLEDSKTGEQPVNLTQKCVECFKGVNLIKTLVIIACFSLVVQQIIGCVMKLIVVPVTTYTHFDFNKTVMYPSVTFCREPAYKFDKLLEYGLYSHPRYTSTWMGFNFSRIPLDQLWDEITYNEQDFFVQYGLENERHNVILTPTMGFITGRCYTVSPKNLDTKASSQAQGYSMSLQHTAADIETATSLIPPGYHVHVHYLREPYTEVEVYNGGLVDYIYVNTGETLDVKLTVDEYIKISDDEDPCTDAASYSTNACTTDYVSSLVEEAAGCSGPWMKSDLPYCDNYEDMRRLISSYVNAHENHGCQTCHRICRSLLYNAYVTDRQKFYTWDSLGTGWKMPNNAADLQTHLYIHFNNMMISVYEERYNYDWNMFVADLGGSVGFLLGLSVIGIFSILGNIWITLIAPLIYKRSTNTIEHRSDSVATIEAIMKNENYQKNN